MKYDNNFIFNIKILIVLPLCFCTSAFAESSDPHGKVWMQGEIVESACTISPESLDQTVDMGEIPIGLLYESNESDYKKFNIDLIDCLWGSDTKNNYTNFDITFTGETEGDYFLVNGEAKGIYLYLGEVNGKQIIPGRKINYWGEGSENISNTYVLKIVTNGEILKTGKFNSLIHFNIKYN